MEQSETDTKLETSSNTTYRVQNQYHKNRFNEWEMNDN